MDWKEEILKYLEKERETVDRAWTAAKYARDHAPSAMESASDTTRSEQEKLGFALEERLRQINEQIKLIGRTEVKYLEVNGLKLVLVPEGMGGKKINDVSMVSVTSPLGRKLREAGN